MNVGRLIMVSSPSRPVLFTCFCSVQVPIPCSSGLPYGTRACTRRITTAGTTRKRKVTTAPTRRVAIPHEAGLILQAPIPRSEGSLYPRDKGDKPPYGAGSNPGYDGCTQCSGRGNRQSRGCAAACDARYPRFSLDSHGQLYPARGGRNRWCVGVPAGNVIYPLCAGRNVFSVPMLEPFG